MKVAMADWQWTGLQGHAAVKECSSGFRTASHFSRRRVSEMNLIRIEGAHDPKAVFKCLGRQYRIRRVATESAGMCHLIPNSTEPIECSLVERLILRLE